ncbi:MAG: toll/interleukin-1 receptor domain-containing protein [Clostridia bacterium]|nr:toll/interleukin-1 receptor domain-containing protein [Clostridia bacterium]
MDKNKLLEVATHMGCARDQVFISTANEDKEYAVGLVRAFDSIGLKHWCMFKADGANVNEIGDDYAKEVEKNVKKSCLVVCLISCSSVYKDGVINELRLINSQIAAGENIPILPVFLGGMSVDVLPYEFREKCRLTSLQGTTIFESLTSSSTEQDYIRLARKIKGQYESTILENIKIAWDNELASRKFSSLLATCSKNRCTSKTVSDDIKESNELAIENLREAHILSNELLEYDYNTYSCMIIALNLLGKDTVSKGVKSYNPKEHGVKYFYYFPRKEAEEVYLTKKKVEGFIKKDISSRREVVSMIRRDFSFRNKILFFLKEFNGKTIGAFKELYHITDKDDSRRFDELFTSNDVQFYFDYKRTGNIFRLPGEVSAWLGDKKKASEYSYEAAAGVAYDFIKFLQRFVEFLNTVNDVNSISYNALISKLDDLLMLKKLDDWQEKRIVLPSSEARQLTTHLLGHEEDDGTDRIPTTGKKYPRLASWMSFDTNSEGGEGPTEREYKEAISNFVEVEIQDNNQLKLCYSFILFVNEKNLVNGAWYSTGYNETRRFVQDMVFTYNIDHQTDECDRLIDAFKFLISINPSAKMKLRENHSNLEQLK